MIDKKWMGAKTKLVPIQVTRTEIQEFCQVIMETNQIYHDTTIAMKAGYEDIPLPPTYPALFWQRIELPWLQNNLSTIQSEQAFSYKNALIANKTYHCQIELQKLRTRENQQFLFHRLSIYDGKELAVTSDTTMLFPYQNGKE